MGEENISPEGVKSIDGKGELFAAFENVPSNDISEVIAVERVPIIRKIFSVLLRPEDYSKMLKENDFLRNPEDYIHNQGPLVDNIANDNKEPSLITKKSA